MLSIERREAILKLMQQKRTASVEYLSGRFFVSEATIRRDLERLARENLIKRTYGGAVLLDGGTSDIPLPLREGENTGPKELLAARAAGLLQNGSTVFLDSSSTASRLVPHLSALSGVTVVTNALKTALKLGEYRGVRVYCTGGLVRDNSISVVGLAARDFLAAYHADFLFFSCRGFSFDAGATEASEEEAGIKRQMIRSAATRVLLCDKSKVGHVYFTTICGLDDIDVIVTDAEFSPDELARLAGAGVRCLRPGAKSGNAGRFDA